MLPATPADGRTCPSPRASSSFFLREAISPSRAAISPSWLKINKTIAQNKRMWCAINRRKTLSERKTGTAALCVQAQQYFFNGLRQKVSGCRTARAVSENMFTCVARVAIDMCNAVYASFLGGVVVLLQEKRKSFVAKQRYRGRI